MQTTFETRNFPETSGPLTKDVLVLANELLFSADANSKCNSKAALNLYLYEHHLLKNLQDLIDYNFKNTRLLIEALGHKSFCHEHPYLCPKSYERLEFLGDALLDFYITERLFKNYPDLNEGDLSKFRSGLVNKKTLYSLGMSIDLQNVILVGNGEFKNNGHVREGIISDIVEALGAAVFLDSNIGQYNIFMDRLIYLYEEKMKKNFFSLEELFNFDPKTKLQEETMVKFKTLPEYLTTETSNGIFESKLTLNAQVISIGHGTSKRDAEKNAAAKAISEKAMKE